MLKTWSWNTWPLKIRLFHICGFRLRIQRQVLESKPWDKEQDNVKSNYIRFSWEYTFEQFVFGGNLK